MAKELPLIIHQIDERSYYEKFAKKLIEHFQDNLNYTNVGTSTDSVYKLQKGFSYRLYFDNNRRINKITLEHKFAGLFVDMGVGKGLSLDEIGYQKIGRTLLGRKVKRRRAKRWYLKTIYGQTIRLMNIVSKHRGDEFTVLVNQSFEKLGAIQIII